METLPKDVNIEILQKLPGDEIIKLCQTSKNLKAVCSDERYNLLWKRKIEEEFKEVYNGDNAFNQYKYLKKLHGQTLYILSYREGEEIDEDSILGIYDTYGKAVMAGVFYFKRYLESKNIDVPIENIRYLLWNRNIATFSDEYLIKIKKVKMENLEEVIDERKFFSDREKLFVDIFGKPSEGRSSQVKNTFELKSGRLGFGIKKVKGNEMDLFFEYLDKIIYGIDSFIAESSSDEVRKTIEFQLASFGFNKHQYDIIEEFVLKNSILKRGDDEGEE